MLSPGWQRRFACDVSPFEIFARERLGYLCRFAIWGPILKRRSGKFGLSDMMLVEECHLLRRNMREDLITLDELTSPIRANGLEPPTWVKAADREGDDEISVIPRGSKTDIADERHR